MAFPQTDLPFSLAAFVIRQQCSFQLLAPHSSYCQTRARQANRISEILSLRMHQILLFGLLKHFSNNYQRSVSMRILNIAQTFQRSFNLLKIFYCLKKWLDTTSCINYIQGQLLETISRFAATKQFTIDKQFAKVSGVSSQKSYRRKYEVFDSLY